VDVQGRLLAGVMVQSITPSSGAVAFRVRVEVNQRIFCPAAR
jgi:hypothetical protein